MLEGQNIT